VDTGLLLQAWVWRLNGHFIGGVDGVFGSYVTITACHLEQAAAACIMSTCTFSPLIVIMHVSYSCHVFRVRLLLHLLCRAHPVLGTYGCLPPSVISADACLWYLTAGNIWQGLKLADWQCCEHANKLIITLSYHYVGVVSFGMNQWRCIVPRNSPC